MLKSPQEENFDTLVAVETPLTADQVHVWLKKEQAARMHDWKRYTALLRSVRVLLKSSANDADANLVALAEVENKLRDPRWVPENNL